MIYPRNGPSALFWDRSNDGVSSVHIQEMAGLKKHCDPNIGRASGCRSLSDTGGTPFAECFRTIVGYDTGQVFNTDTDYFRDYSNAYRNELLKRLFYAHRVVGSRTPDFLSSDIGRIPPEW